jgi:hypothetical protein
MGKYQVRAGIRSTVTAAALATIVVIPSFVGVAVAGAATSGPGSYTAASTATALQAAIAGKTQTEGVSKAQSNSSPSASANGIGDLLLPGTNQSVTVSTPGTSKSLPQACATPTLPGLTLGLACGGPVTAAVDSSKFPSDTAHASAGTISLGGANPLSSLLNPVTSSSSNPVTSALTGLLGSTPLGAPLNSILGSLGTSGSSPLTSVLKQLGAAVGGSTTLATVGAGRTTASTSTTATTVTATSTGNAVTIQLLPGVIPGFPSLATITVTLTTTTATLDRTTGAGTASSTPAIVSVSVLGHSVTIPPSGSTSAPGIPNTPLSTLLTLTILKGSTTQGQGAASATANSLSIDLLPGLASGGSGVLDLTLGATTSSVSGVAIATPVTTTISSSPGTTITPVTVPTVPTVVAGVPTATHTGEPWAGSIPLVVLALAAGIALVWRRRLALAIPSMAHAGRSLASTTGHVGRRLAHAAHRLNIFGRGASGPR